MEALAQIIVAILLAILYAVVGQHMGINTEIAIIAGTLATAINFKK